MVQRSRIVIDLAILYQPDELVTDQSDA
jgi:hypothetical protein